MFLYIYIYIYIYIFFFIVVNMTSRGMQMVGEVVLTQLGNLVFNILCTSQCECPWTIHSDSFLTSLPGKLWQWCSQTQEQIWYLKIKKFPTYVRGIEGILISNTKVQMRDLDSRNCHLSESPTWVCSQGMGRITLVHESC